MRSLIGGLASALRNEAPIPYVSERQAAVAGSRLFAPIKNDSESQLKAMRAVGTLYAIVHRESTATAQVAWHLYRKSTDQRRRYGPTEETRTEVTKHLALDIWNKPNDFMTRQELMEGSQQHVELTGEGWLVISYLDAAKTIPGEMWPVRPDRMTPVPSAKKFLAGYVYTGPDGEQIPLDLKDVMMIRVPDPEDPYRGLSAVGSVMTDLQASKLSAEWNRNFFLNSAEPGGIIQVEQSLDDTEFLKLQRRWNEQHKGVSKAHRVAILEYGKWVPNAISQRDMQFVQLRTSSRDTILEAFTFPKSMAGVTEDVNRANAETGEEIFAKWHTVERLDRWKSLLNNDFLPKFGATGQGLEFDYENPVPESREQKNAELTAQTAAYKTLTDAGVDPVDAAMVCGLPEMKTVKLAPPPPAPPPPGQPAPSEPPAADPSSSAPAAQAHRLEIVVHGGGGGSAAPVVPVVVGAAAEPPNNDVPAHSVDIAPVLRALERALEELLKDWADVQAAQIDALVEQVQTIVANDNLPGLPDMTVPTDDAHATLLAAMTALGAGAADQVVDEADKQDVTISAVPPAHDTLSADAAVTVGILARTLATSAATEALRQAGTGAEAAAVADAVRSHLDSLTDAQPALQLGAGLHRAQHAGRASTLAAAEHTVTTHEVTYYASEVNDTNTCGPCSREDGQVLGHKFGETTADYPTGGYAECEGRLRCRGHVVAVWTIEESTQ